MLKVVTETTFLLPLRQFDLGLVRRGLIRSQCRRGSGGRRAVDTSILLESDGFHFASARSIFDRPFISYGVAFRSFQTALSLAPTLNSCALSLR
jgi:hypothetical protein